jgi:hypothetical protein
MQGAKLVLNVWPKSIRGGGGETSVKGRRRAVLDMQDVCVYGGYGPIVCTTWFAVVCLGLCDGSVSN